MRTADCIFGWLLILASIMHAYGSIASYSKTPVTLVWALSGALAGILVASLNLLRIGRAQDRPLTWLSLGGTVAWMAVAIAFGAAAGNVLDPRPMTHVAIAVVLIAMCVRTLLNRRVVSM